MCNYLIKLTEGRCCSQVDTLARLHLCDFYLTHTFIFGATIKQYGYHLYHNKLQLFINFCTFFKKSCCVFKRFHKIAKRECWVHHARLPVFMYGCMHVCMHVCVYVCMYACVYACVYVCMHACMHVCVYVCTWSVQKVSDLNFSRINKSSTGSVHHCRCGGDIYAHA